MILQLIKFRLVQFLQAILSLLPVSKNKIVFANFLGRGMGGSPKYIAEEILRQGLPYDMVWLVSDTSETFPSGIRPIKMFSLRGRYELATARIIINNVKHKLPFKKKESSITFKPGTGILLSNISRKKLKTNWIRYMSWSLRQTPKKPIWCFLAVVNSRISFTMPFGITEKSMNVAFQATTPFSSMMII